MKLPFKKNKAKKLKSLFPGLILEKNVGIIGDHAHLQIGQNILFQRNVVIHLGGFEWDNFSGSLKIGDNAVVSYGTVIYAAGPGGVDIGNNFDCGPNCGIFSSQSDYKNKGKHLFEKVTIGDDVILYHNVTIIPGVTIGKGAVVAAGSVVTKDVASYTMVGGVPAEVIKVINQNKV